MFVRIRAFRRAGEIFGEMRRDGSRRPRGKSHIARGDMRQKTLADLGISLDDASYWMRLAGIPGEGIATAVTHFDFGVNETTDWAKCGRTAGVVLGVNLMWRLTT